MSKPLTRTTQKIYHYDDGAKVDGAHNRLTGDVSDLWGDVTNLTGNVTNLRGNVNGLRGDVDEIPDSARPCDISDWIEE